MLHIIRIGSLRKIVPYFQKGWISSKQMLKTERVSYSRSIPSIRSSIIKLVFIHSSSVFDAGRRETIDRNTAGSSSDALHWPISIGHKTRHFREVFGAVVVNLTNQIVPVHPNCRGDSRNNHDKLR